jgi:hypothetical protein
LWLAEGAGRTTSGRGMWKSGGAKRDGGLDDAGAGACAAGAGAGAGAGEGVGLSSITKMSSSVSSSVSV